MGGRHRRPRRRCARRRASKCCGPPPQQLLSTGPPSSRSTRIWSDDCADATLVLLATAGRDSKIATSTVRRFRVFRTTKGKTFHWFLATASYQVVGSICADSGCFSFCTPCICFLLPSSLGRALESRVEVMKSVVGDWGRMGQAFGPDSRRRS